MLSKITIISTVFYGRIFNTTFDIENIFNMITIDNTFVGAKFHNRYKGDIKKTSCFFNQVTLKCYSEKYDKFMNVKIFENGNYQITGSRDSEQVAWVLRRIIKMIYDIHGVETREVTVHNGIIHDKEEYDLLSDKKKYQRFERVKVYSPCGNLIGYKNHEYYVINNDKTSLYPGIGFESVSNVNVNNIYNFRGEKIGISENTFINKNKRRMKNLKFHPTDVENEFDIIHKGKYIGKRRILLDSPRTIKGPDLVDGYTKLDVHYRGIRGDSVYNEVKSGDFFKNFRENINLKVANINSKMDLLLTHEEGGLNMSKLADILHKKYNIDCYYNPSSMLSVITACIYTDEDHRIVKKENAYHKGTMRIFRTGRIIVNSTKTKYEIVVLKKYIHGIFDTIRKDIVCYTNNDVEIKDENITIFDI